MAKSKGTYRGTRSVGGKQVRDYVFSVPVEAYAQLMSPRAVKTLKQVLTGPVRVEYLVDKESLPVKVSTTLNVRGEQQVTAIDYSAWGKRVHISAPPKRQVATAAQMGQAPA